MKRRAIVFHSSPLWLACAFAVIANASTEVVLHNFGTPPRGGTPYSNVIRDAKGNLYGTTYYGGNAGVGVIYKVSPQGQQTILHSFSGPDGAYPLAGVIRDSAGNLYGTTGGGGTANAGVVYKLDASGHETVLHNFTGGADGANPSAGVIRDSVSNLYGTTAYGGTVGGGVVYKLDPGRHLTVLHNFTDAPDGYTPYAGVVMDPGGNLYGTTYAGGSHYAGTVYKVDPSGQETILYNCGWPNVANPDAGVVLDSAGNTYGTGLNVVFKIDQSGGYSALYTFTGGADGSWPYASVALDSAGNLYGTTVSGGPAAAGVIFKLDSTGHETVLYGFAGGGDGKSPYAGVTLDSSGNVYGTTTWGGAGNQGTVFKLDSTGNKTTLYSFPSMTDGANPHAGLVRDSKHNFYGTTEYGGQFNSGIVFKMDTKGDETVLYSFTGGADGSNPVAGLTLDLAGNLYGTTLDGGPSGAGVVFRLDPAGHETVLYGFSGGADGSNPKAGVIRDASGNLYGTTYNGGYGLGTVFKLDTSGHETVLWTFRGSTDGAFPAGGLVSDSAGNLYGTTETGNDFSNGGVVFKVSPQGAETVLHIFSVAMDGAMPEATLMLDPAGNLYGTTADGGAEGLGVVFKIDPNGNETVLYTFAAVADGFSPYAGVIQDSAGNFYGTTTSGGSASWPGVVYKLDPSGNETVLYSFTGGHDGGYPYAGLVFDAAGNLYGTTANGGLRSTGVIYQIRP